MTCVCAHTRDEHLAATMSVPLDKRGPALYPVQGSMFANVAATSPNATYERDECHCGCCAYLEDAGP